MPTQRKKEDAYVLGDEKGEVLDKEAGEALCKAVEDTLKKGQHVNTKQHDEYIKYCVHVGRALQVATPTAVLVQPLPTPVQPASKLSRKQDDAYKLGEEKGEVLESKEGEAVMKEVEAVIKKGGHVSTKQHDLYIKYCVMYGKPILVASPTATTINEALMSSRSEGSSSSEEAPASASAVRQKNPELQVFEGLAENCLGFMQRKSDAELGRAHTPVLAGPGGAAGGGLPAPTTLAEFKARAELAEKRIGELTTRFNTYMASSAEGQAQALRIENLRLKAEIARLKGV